MAGKKQKKFTKPQLTLLSKAQPSGKHIVIVCLNGKPEREAAKELAGKRLGGGVTAAVVGFTATGEPSAFTLVGTPRKQFLLLADIAGGQRLGWDISEKPAARASEKGE